MDICVQYTKEECNIHIEEIVHKNITIASIDVSTLTFVIAQD